MSTSQDQSRRRRRGLARLREMAGIDALEQFRESLLDVAPDLADYVVDFVYGDVFSRSGLQTRDQEIVTLSTLASIGGCETQLRLHVQIALNIGMHPAEIVDVLIQTAPYAGFPRALNAIEAARRVFVSQGLISPGSREGMSVDGPPAPSGA